MNKSYKMAGPPREKTRDEIDMKLLRELATLPANKYCFDCGQRGPTYVNVTIGSFVCSSCGGLLRGLNPPHRVKSLTVCSFTEVEMDRIKSRGNEYCTHIWLGKFDPKTENIDLSSPDKRKEFMILKYEEKKFYVDPRDAVKKMKPRAPAVPSVATTVSTVPRSQTVMQDKQSIQIQRPGALPQAFSAGDISNNAVPNLIKSLDNDPFQEMKQTENGGDGASFADFSSAFGNTSSKDTSSIQLPTSINSSSTHKKPAPPPPDRYAALADLDNQLHQQVAPDISTSTSVTSINSTPFWSTTSAMPSTAVFTSGIQNPFQTAQPWPPTAPCTQNPFQVVAQPIPVNNTILPQQSTNGVPNTAKPSLPNGSVGTVYWPSASSQPWRGQIQNNIADPFSNKTVPGVDNYNPWAQSLGANNANPFMNGSFTPGQPSNSSGTNTRNPFL